MVDLDVTNRELARRLRLRENTLSRYINGRRRNPEAARLLARALKMKIEEITLKNGDRAA